MGECVCVCLRDHFPSGKTLKGKVEECRPEPDDLDSAWKYPGLFPFFCLRILVYLVIYDSGLVSLGHLLLLRYPSPHLDLCITLKPRDE